ncbi:MAG: PAP/fibrillin family protein [Snowella sp.]|nr:PAP/fibrillin family protein [Snowella sp.]
MLETRQALKEKLFAKIDPLQKRKQGAPLTNAKLDANLVQEIEQLTESLEAVNPNLYPLLHRPQLLDGAWQLNYSTAREIRSLDKLPYGFKVGKVYQVIDVTSQSFLNLAFVKHALNLASGYVKVTANFELAKMNGSALPDKRVNVQFRDRIFAIQKITGINTPKLDPLKVVAARGPVGRIPSLDITYIDETMRIGRGGDGSLFILSKASTPVP